MTRIKVYDTFSPWQDSTMALAILEYMPNCKRGFTPLATPGIPTLTDEPAVRIPWVW